MGSGKCDIRLLSDSLGSGALTLIGLASGSCSQGEASTSMITKDLAVVDCSLGDANNSLVYKSILISFWIRLDPFKTQAQSKQASFVCSLSEASLLLIRRVRSL
ncbi:unnamed protein product [Prunus armeniaca]|uniref:Uncharacterized protein n=1 Tax=Prunus armeniaca TaxID=36596 RepID=A0A6J5VQL8_PRUAR|nr:unnamed protein product [Prunus armeniaca]CAB4320894.1 unnamed protein product [Prunus armeniaca]